MKHPTSLARLALWTAAAVLAAALRTSTAFAPPAASLRCCTSRHGTGLFAAASGDPAKRPFSGVRRPFTKSGAYVSPSPAHPPRPRRSTKGDGKGAAPTGGPSKMSSAVLEAPRPAAGPSSRVADFQDRMRRLVTRDRERESAATRRRTGSEASRGHPNVRVVHSLEEYKAVVGDESDRLVVVRFYATWCKACKAMAPLFYRLAGTYKDAVFVEVPVTDRNASLHQGLGVPSLPFGHIYHPRAGLVEELKINRKYFAEFAHTVKAYRSGTCDLPGGDPANPFGAAKEEESTASSSSS